MGTDQPQRSSRRRRWILIACCAYLLLEVASFSGLWILKSAFGVEFSPVSTSVLPDAVQGQLDRILEGRETYLQHDPDLGWSPRPNGKNDLCQANGQGIRANREYSKQPGPGIVRVATFGDSFTHGDDVSNESTWQVQLEPLLADAEVLNFGVGASGVDQAYLRYLRDGRQYAPQVVLIGVMSENLHRSINVWRPYYRSHYAFPLTKPRFRLEDHELVLVPNPLTSLAACRQLRDDPGSLLAGIAEHDSLFADQYTASPLDFLPSVRLGKMLDRERKLRSHPIVLSSGGYNPDHEAFLVLTSTLEAFAEAVQAENAKPLIVLLPDNILPKGSTQAAAYAPLLEWLEEHGLDHVDMQAGFDRYQGSGDPQELHVGRFGHYSPKANNMVARALRDELTSRSWVEPAAPSSTPSKH